MATRLRNSKDCRGKSGDLFSLGLPYYFLLEPFCPLEFSPLPRPPSPRSSLLRRRILGTLSDATLLHPWHLDARDSPTLLLSIAVGKLPCHLCLSFSRDRNSCCEARESIISAASQLFQLRNLLFSTHIFVSRCLRRIFTLFPY
jgi:hypothetical protein